MRGRPYSITSFTVMLSCCWNVCSELVLTASAYLNYHQIHFPKVMISRIPEYSTSRCILRNNDDVILMSKFICYCSYILQVVSPSSPMFRWTWDFLTMGADWNRIYFLSKADFTENPRNRCCSNSILQFWCQYAQEQICRLVLVRYKKERFWIVYLFSHRFVFR